MAEDFQVLAKSPEVLWALTPDGILLHHMATDKYVELGAANRCIWEYLDGFHSVEEALARASTDPSAAVYQAGKELVQSLLEAGFLIVEA